MPRKPLTAISLFSGAMGLDLGLEKAGFEIRVAVECNRFAVKTIKANKPHIAVIDKPLEAVRNAEILRAAKLKRGEATLVVGGLCCQSFSTAGQRGSLGDPRGQLVNEFIRVVRGVRPRFFVIENVRGMVSAALRHRPLAQRGPGCRRLQSDEELGSGFAHVLKLLRRLGYYVVFDIVNAADFGVPQTRERLLIVGSRDGEDIIMPTPTHSRSNTNGLPRWLTLREALKGLKEGEREFTAFPRAWKPYLSKIPAGGNWRDLSPRLRKKALGSAFQSWGGRSGFFRRLSWNRPSPSLTTRPSSKATLHCHPDEVRPLSVAEYSRIQQFPDDWIFVGGTPQKYVQIGNAVPVGLGYAIGLALRETTRTKTRGKTGIICPDQNLIERISKRPATILNPPRMRKKKSVEAARKWANGSPRSRTELVKLINGQSNGAVRIKGSGRR